MNIYRFGYCRLTSGLVILAKSKEVARKISLEIFEKETKKVEIKYKLLYIITISKNPMISYMYVDIYICTFQINNIM